MDLKTQSELGIGLIRNDEYIGFYFNLTAWNIKQPSNVIQLSLRQGFLIIKIYKISLKDHFVDQAMMKLIKSSF